MKLTLDFDKKEVTLFEDTDIVELVAQLVVVGNPVGWRIKVPEKIVEVEKWSYYPYYPYDPYKITMQPLTQPYYCSDSYSTGGKTIYNPNTSTTAYPKGTNISFTEGGDYGLGFNC